MRKTVFIKNAMILTASSLILRFAGIIFKIWIANEVGSEGIGLYQLIFSVYVLASTFAQSGISTAVTRLVAEEMAVGAKKGAQKVLLRAVELTLLASVFSAVLLLIFSDVIAVKLIGDTRAAVSLKILPLSLPFLGITSCFRGYFIARRKVTPNATSQIFEQAVRIAICLYLVKRYVKKGLKYACAALMAGDVFSEILACLFLGMLFLIDKKCLKSTTGGEKAQKGVLKNILHIAVPITSGRYLNSLLRTSENILVPKNLSRYSLSGSNALSQFGMIKGMALPILFFPSAILNAVSTLLIPEMSEALALGRHQVVKYSVRNILKLTGITAFIFAAIFWCGGEEIGYLIYKERDVGSLLKVLSPLVPLMYLDSISDGILKGLDQQGFTFKTSVSDSVIRLCLIPLLLPNLGLQGFILIMYFSNILTCLMNVSRLLKVSGAAISLVKEIVFPVALAFGICRIFDALLASFQIENSLVCIILLGSCSILCYFCVLFATKTVNAEMLMSIKGKKKSVK